MSLLDYPELEGSVVTEHPDMTQAHYGTALLSQLSQN